MRTPGLAAVRGRMRGKGGSEERSEIRDTLFSTRRTLVRVIRVRYVDVITRTTRWEPAKPRKESRDRVPNDGICRFRRIRIDKKISKFLELRENIHYSDDIVTITIAIVEK